MLRYACLTAAVLTMSLGSTGVTFAGTHKAGASVRHATHRANANAGTAKEIAPDSKQSATGGQPGGLPGHE